MGIIEHLCCRFQSHDNKLIAGDSPLNNMGTRDAGKNPHVTFDYPPI